MPIDEAIASAAEELASSPLPDRHVLVSLGAPVTLDAAQQAELTADLDSANARLHLLTPSAAPELTNVAVASGGLAPATTELVAAADRVLGALTDRYRAVTTVSGPGSHEVALELGGTRYTAPVNVVAPVAPPPTSPATPAPTTEAPTAAAPATTARTAVSASEGPASTASAAPAPAAPVTTAASASADDGGGVGIIAVIVALLRVDRDRRRGRRVRPARSTPVSRASSGGRT